MKANLAAGAIAIVAGLPLGWIVSMLMMPLLWRLEPVLHMELAGHSGPSDWVFYVVWGVMFPALFLAFRRVLRSRRELSANQAEAQK